MKRSVFLFTLMACFLIISCSFDSPVDASDSDAVENPLIGKDTILYTGSLVLNEIRVPASVYISNTDDEFVHLVWIEPDDSYENFGGVYVTYSYMDIQTTNPKQEFMPIFADKGSHCAKSSHAYLFEKDYPDFFELLKAHPEKEQDMSLFDSKNRDTTVINLRAYDKDKNLGPMSSVVSVIGHVTTNKALGCAYNVADNEEFITAKLGGQVIDVLALKNYNLYSMSQINLNETTQSHITGDSKEEFINKVTSTKSKSLKLNFGTKILKTVFKLDFQKSFSENTVDTTGTSEKDFYSLFTAKVLKCEQKILDSYASPDILKKFLMPAFKSAINDPNVAPETIFKNYGTHVLTDIELGGRLEMRMKGRYTEDSVSKDSTTTTNKVIVAVSEGTSDSSSFKSSIGVSDITVNVESYGGGSNVLTLWNGSALKGDINAWSKSVGDTDLIGSSTCIDNEDWSTGIWLYADDSARQREIRDAYYSKLYGNYASLISGPIYTNDDDGPYIRSFGFVTISDPTYPYVNMNTRKRLEVESDDGFIYLNDKTGDFPDFDADSLKKLAVESEKKKGNSDISENDIVFYKKKGGGIFKIVDGQRNIYSDPTDDGKSKDGTRSYNVRLSSLRYTHSPERPFEVDRDYISGVTFFYPYKVLTNDPNKALYGIFSSDYNEKYSSNRSVQANTHGKTPDINMIDSVSSFVCSPEDMNNLFENLGIDDVCYNDTLKQPYHDNGYEIMRKQAAADSWKPVANRYFNIMRSDDARYSEYGTGDILENPIDRGEFDFIEVGYVPKYVQVFLADGGMRHREYPLSDTAFCSLKSNSKYQLEFKRYNDVDNWLSYTLNYFNNSGDSNDPFSGKRLEPMDYFTTFIPVQNNIIIKCPYTTKSSNAFRQDRRWISSYYYQFRDSNDTDGYLFNSLYPDKFPYSGPSCMTPSMVFTSDMMDENGNIRSFGKTKPIKDIDFIFCKTSDPNPMAPVESLSNTGSYDWEIVDFPVGAGEWKMLDSWSTKKDIRMHEYCDAFPNKSNHIRFAVDLYNSKVKDIENNLARYSSGALSNYFTKYTDKPDKIDFSDPKNRYIYLKECVTDTDWGTNINYTYLVGPENTWLEFKNQISNSSAMMDEKAMSKSFYRVHVAIRDMDRYDIYIRYRR